MIDRYVAEPLPQTFRDASDIKFNVHRSPLPFNLILDIAKRARWPFRKCAIANWARLFTGDILVLKAADGNACFLCDFQKGSLLANRNSGGEQYVNYFTIAGQR